MEIERQFLVESLPSLPTEYETIRQGYVALEPEIRIRRYRHCGNDSNLEWMGWIYFDYGE